MTDGAPPSGEDTRAPERGEPPEPPAGRLAERLRGFGPVGILAMLAVFALGPILEPLGGLLVLGWGRLTRTPWRELGFGRPPSWTRTVVTGVAFGVAFKFFMKAVVMPLLGADPLNRAYHFLVGNAAALPRMVVAVVVGAGFGEEALYRGFAFERLGRLLGRGPRATILIVALTSAWFGLMHYPEQGLAGTEQAWVTGLVFGTIYAVSGRLWMVMVAHAAFDLAAVAIIYWNLEARVAHLVFR